MSTASTADAAAPREILIRVLLALAPGLTLHALLIDAGVLLRLAVLAAVCGALESLFATLRARALRAPPDLSCLVTAVVLALAVPVALPLLLTALAGTIAIAIGRHALAGPGSYGFNPAMVGYAVIAVFAPASMYVPVDATSGATMLTLMQEALRQQRTLGEVFATAAVGTGQLVTAIAWLGGGAWLIRRGLVPWRIPLGVLLGLCACALVPWMLESDRHASPLLHLLSGSVLLAAFFVATDPASSPRSAGAHLLYGAGIGALLYAIRGWSHYPDGIAFAVLLMNFLAPMLDRCGLATTRAEGAG